MYTVLIVEDELLVRIGIASSVPWAELNMRLIGEAEDGVSAWALYEKHRPDIVITDIRMPGIDGLELLQRIRSGDRQCAVIIITNVEHDDTLEEARKLGVTDVLLKAAMKQEDIRLALEKACLGLPDAERAEIQPDGSALWRAALLDGNLSSAPEGDHGLVMLHIFPGDRVSHRLKDSLIDLTDHELGGEADLGCVRTESGALFVRRGGFDLKEEVRTLSELQRYVWDVFGVRVGYAHVSEACGVSRLRKAYQTMRALTAWEAFFERGTLTLDACGAYADPTLQRLQRRMDGLSCLSDRDPVLKGFTAALSRYPGSLAGGWEPVRTRGENVLAAVGTHETCGCLRAMTDRICECGEELADRIERSLKPEILTVISYVDGHLDEELSIPQVSGLIGYQPKYFSRLFKNEMGCNYSDYLTSRRISRARELLAETTLPIQEIAERCGFSEVSYFSSRFKQETGMTPKQMRASQ